MNYLLEEAEGPIREALERLVAKDEDVHPFIVIDKVGRPDIFVQFCTNHGVLLFDVPALKLYAQPTTVAFGALQAVTTLRASLGVRPEERVNIHEEDDQPSKGQKISLWEKITRIFAPAAG